jgi:CheY-like chemotaxis protein
MRTVLYIEDNPSNVDLVDSVLSVRPDIRLIAAPDGPTGLELANAKRPDLILVDIGLPGIDGYEICRRLRAREDLKATPILALSANAMQVDIERGRVAGFDDYLTKPLDVKLFLLHVDRLLQRGAP